MEHSLLKETYRKIIIKTTSICFGILFFGYFLNATNGDLANGLLFFLSAVFSIPVITVLIIIFGFNFLFAATASNQIIIQKKSFVLVAFKLVLIVSAIVAACIIAFSYFLQSPFIGIGDVLAILKSSLPVIITLLVIWLWTANQIRLKLSAI